MTTTGPSRRHVLRGALAGSAGLVLAGSALREAQAGGHEPSAADRPAAHGQHGQHGGGAAGATFRRGSTVDHAANGFSPTELLRDFDHGTTSRLPDGRVLREWEVFTADRDLEVAPGVTFPAWTFNSRVPGPTLRCTEGDRLRVHFTNGSAHPHTMHFHGIHPAAMDGVPGIGPGVIEPGQRVTYEFDAAPFGVHLYHCHVSPLAEHIARGLYGTFIVDPRKGRPAADEVIMVMHGWNTTFDGEGNQLYAVNGIPFHYMNEPVRVRRGELVRIYLVNILEYDPINSFHLHGNFFDYYPTGTRLEPSEFTDTVVLGQGQRGICEVRFPYAGSFMFHAHKTEFADLGWMGMIEVVDP
ncbi:MAG: multicopper oxidase domain-containing protein [Actinomycetota bacterium]|nr:multicopper oxidase domain-containing protein [Actinomycetota bacterium]